MTSTNTRFHLLGALGDAWNRRSVTLLSMATIAASLYIVGLFLLAARGIQPLLMHWSDDLSVSVFLGEGATPGQIEAIREKIQTSDAVRSFQHLDRDAALGRFCRDFPDLSDLPELLRDNPFPASFELKMRPEKGGPAQVGALAESLTSMPGVQEV